MKKTIFSFMSLVLLAVAILFLGSDSHEDPYREYLIQEIDTVDSYLGKINSTKVHSERLAYYHQARKHYKHIQLFTEHFSPHITKYELNGPLIYKHDLEITGEVYPPNGFQRVEEILFAENGVGLEVEINQLKKSFTRIRKLYQGTQFNEAVLLEAAQLELYRLATLNLNGFDATYSLTNVQEAIWSVEGMESAIQSVWEGADAKAMSEKEFLSLECGLDKLKSFLESNKDYNSFDRLEYIKDYAIPINKLFIDFHNASKLPWYPYTKAIDLRQENLYTESAFELYHFSPFRGKAEEHEKLVELGKMLFFDPIMSGNGERSCASCHDPNKAFTDGLPKSLAENETSVVSRNAPSLIDVYFQQLFFFDGRVFQLERQVFDVVHNKEEMKGNLVDVAKTLSRSDEYVTLFTEAFPPMKGYMITPSRIKKAIAAYERSLVSFDSKFDRYLRGDKSALSKREKNGYNLFAGKALCATCHFFPVFNGTIPPYFTDTEFEVLGVPIEKESNKIDPDLGRYEVSHQSIHRHSFKTPTVRNAALTGPYMHNGIFTTLKEVVDFYHKGGGADLQPPLDNQTLPFDSLDLSDREKEDIVLFMETLTDTSGLTSKPNRLPRFPNDEQLNGRIIGGKY